MIDITDAVIRDGREQLRRKTGNTPFCIIVGEAHGHLVGKVIDGLPVIHPPYPLHPSAYQFAGIAVQDPWTACTDLGME